MKWAVFFIFINFANIHTASASGAGGHASIAVPGGGVWGEGLVAPGSLMLPSLHSAQSQPGPGLNSHRTYPSSASAAVCLLCQSCRGWTTLHGSLIPTPVTQGLGQALWEFRPCFAWDLGWAASGFLLLPDLPLQSPPSQHSLTRTSPISCSDHQVCVHSTPDPDFFISILDFFLCLLYVNSDNHWWKYFWLVCECRIKSKFINVYRLKIKSSQAYTWALGGTKTAYLLQWNRV